MLRKKSVYFLFFMVISLQFDVSSQDVIKILPLGNSITYDQRNIDSRPAGDKISYRYKLYQLLAQAGYNFDFIGSYKSGCNYFADCDNSGFKGIDTENLADLVATGTSEFTGSITAGPYLNSYPADIILLEIGTNDMIHNQYVATEINNLLNSVDLYEQLSGNPVLVIIGTIISIQNFPCGSHAGVNSFNNNLEQMVQNRINNGDKLILTDMECGAGINYYNDMHDELHPNQTGYDKMGQKWFSTIDAINARPVVFNIPDQQVAEGSNFTSINLNSYVNDADDPDNVIIWTTGIEPLNLTVTINTSNIATIIPKDPEWNGSETVTFIAKDPGKYIPELHGSDQDDVVFTITPVNDSPVINSQKNDIVIDEDGSYEITINDLVISDPDDPEESLSLIIKPGINYEYSGSVIAPSRDFFGELYVNLVVFDGKSQSNNFQFIINVNEVNDPPVITSIPKTDADDYVSYSYTLTAFDPEDQNIIFEEISVPDWADFSPENGVLSGVPRYSDIGDYEVILKASDGIEGSEQIFTIHVSDVNDAPVFTSQPDTLIITGEEYVYVIAGDDVDEDDILSYSVIEKPEWLDFNASDNSLHGIPDTSDLGIYPVVILLTDGKDNTEQEFKLYVSLYTGKNHINIQNHINVYPNPASDFVIVSSPIYKINRIAIYDLNGRQLLSETSGYQGGEMRLDISGLPSGVYIIHSETSGGLFRVKLVK